MFLADFFWPALAQATHDCIERGFLVVLQQWCRHKWMQDFYKSFSCVLTCEQFRLGWNQTCSAALVSSLHPKPWLPSPPVGNKHVVFLNSLFVWFLFFIRKVMDTTRARQRFIAPSKTSSMQRGQQDLIHIRRKTSSVFSNQILLHDTDLWFLTMKLQNV